MTFSLLGLSCCVAAGSLDCIADSWMVGGGAIVEANKGGQTCGLTDPDGNTFWRIVGFRVEY